MRSEPHAARDAADNRDTPAAASTGKSSVIAKVSRPAGMENPRDHLIHSYEEQALDVLVGGFAHTSRAFDIAPASLASSDPIYGEVCLRMLSHAFDLEDQNIKCMEKERAEYIMASAISAAMGTGWDSEDIRLRLRVVQERLNEPAGGATDAQLIERGKKLKHALQRGLEKECSDDKLAEFHLFSLAIRDATLLCATLTTVKSGIDLLNVCRHYSTKHFGALSPVTIETLTCLGEGYVVLADSQREGDLERKFLREGISLFQQAAERLEQTRKAHMPLYGNLQLFIARNALNDSPASFLLAADALTKLEQYLPGCVTNQNIGLIREYFELNEGIDRSLRSCIQPTPIENATMHAIFNQTENRDRIVLELVNREPALKSDLLLSGAVRLRCLQHLFEKKDINAVQSLATESLTLDPPLSPCTQRELHRYLYHAGLAVQDFKSAHLAGDRVLELDRELDPPQIDPDAYVSSIISLAVPEPQDHLAWVMEIARPIVPLIPKLTEEIACVAFLLLARLNAFAGREGRSQFFLEQHNEIVQAFSGEAYDHPMADVVTRMKVRSLTPMDPTHPEHFIDAGWATAQNDIRYVFDKLILKLQRVKEPLIPDETERAVIEAGDPEGRGHLNPRLGIDVQLFRSYFCSAFNDFEGADYALEEARRLLKSSPLPQTNRAALIEYATGVHEIKRENIEKGLDDIWKAATKLETLSSPNTQLRTIYQELEAVYTALENEPERQRAESALKTTERLLDELPEL